MTVFTYHLLRTSPVTSLRAFVATPSAADVPGLQHAECMTTMKLGSRVVSPSRLQLGHLAVFASWDDEAAIDNFLVATPLGRKLAAGWHVRLEFLRRWGHISEFAGLPEDAGIAHDPASPVVAVTLARLKYLQIPRFIRWGKPVERLVRDHPGTTLALASMHPMRTVSTLSVWTAQSEMTDMVAGHSNMAEPDRHATAMVERSRKDFHFEFTTLRFRSLSEHGQWEGRSSIVPVAN